MTDQNIATNTNETPPNLPGQLIKRDLARQVPVKLTEHEIAQRGKGASTAAIELAKLKAEAKEHASRWKERIDAKQAELDKFLTTLGSGEEDRIVTCHERFHAGTVLTIREDTWEVVGTPRPARPDERQLAIPSNSGGLIDTANQAQAHEANGSAEPKQTGFDEDEEEADEPEPDEDADAKPKKRGRGNKPK